MSVVQNDTFSRANQTGGWGTASDGESWSIASGSSANVQIVGNEGNVYQPLTTSVTNVMLLGTTTTLDSEILVRFRVHDPAHDTARLVFRAVDGSNFYTIGYTTTNLLQIAKVVTGTLTSLASVTFTPSVDTFYWLRGRIVGNWLYAKVWQDGTAEPTDWTLVKQDINNTYTAAGKSGLRGVTNNASGVLFDSFTLDNQPGQFTGGGGAGGSCVGVSVPTLAPTVFSDTFERPAVSGTLGTATDGNTWTTLAGTGTFGTDGSNLYAYATAITLRFALGTLSQARGADEMVLFRFNSGGTTSNAVRALLRAPDGSNGYVVGWSQGKLTITTDINNTLTDVATSPMTIAAGTWYWVRAQVTGTVLSVKLWTDGTPEPDAAQLVYNDTAATYTVPGQMGLRIAATGSTLSSGVLVSDYSAQTVLEQGAAGGVGVVMPMVSRAAGQSGGKALDPFMGYATGGGGGAGVVSMALFAVGKAGGGSSSGATSWLSCDSFVRPDQAGWGIASDGETWTPLRGTGTLGITANQGTLYKSNTITETLLGTQTVSDTDVLFRFTTSVPTSDTARAMLRFQAGSGSFYGVGYAGSRLHIDYYNSQDASPLILASTFSPIQTNVSYWVRARISGNTLMARLWQDVGTSSTSSNAVIPLEEPQQWQIVATDNTISAAGNFGLRMWGSSLIAPTDSVPSGLALDHYQVQQAPPVQNIASAGARGMIQNRLGRGALPQFDYVVFIAMENRDRVEVVDNANAPNINSVFVQGGAELANYQSLGGADGTHHSEPNYLMWIGGDNFGISDDALPQTDSAHSIVAPTLVDSLEQYGYTWGGYMESMPTTVNAWALNGGGLDTAGNELYQAHHNPFPFFDSIYNVPQRAARVHPLSQLYIDLQSVATTPNFIWITPNMVHLMHDPGGAVGTPQSNTSVSTGDAWFQTTLWPLITSSPAWQAGRMLVMMVWDESNLADPVDVPAPALFVASGAQVTAGASPTNFYTPYNILRTIEQLFALPTLTVNDAAATTITDIWATSGTLDPTSAGGASGTISTLTPGGQPGGAGGFGLVLFPAPLNHTVGGGGFGLASLDINPKVHILIWRDDRSGLGGKYELLTVFVNEQIVAGHVWDTEKGFDKSFTIYANELAP